MPAPRLIKIFIASPGDLAVERRAFKDTIDELNAGYGRGAKVQLEPLGWEDALAQVGRRSQSVINQDVDACDVFVLVMWRRWGQEAPDAAPYTSYTEEEFYRALARFEKDGKPTIFVFFKHIDPGQMADPGEQLKKVLAFRKSLEETRKVLYHGFDDEERFEQEIDRHLVAFAEAKCGTIAMSHATPIMPDSIKNELDRHRFLAQRAVDELEKLKAEAKRALEEAEKARAEAKDATARAEAAESVSEARAARQALALAESAARAALEGKIEEARQGFARALDGTTNLRILFLGSEFFQRIGDLDEAERLVRRCLAISGPEGETGETATAWCNLGVIYRMRGDLNKAEEMLRKSLTVNEKLGRLEGMGSAYGNLGVIYRSRGDLDQADEMHKKSLAVSEKLGLLDEMAKDYGNLGVVYAARGDLNGAEEMHRKALAINETLGRLEGMGSAYGNLGWINRIRGDLDQAEEMHKKSLALAMRVGSAELTANQKANLGLVAEQRGQLEAARSLWEQALVLYEHIGMKTDIDWAREKLDELRN